MTDNSPVTEAEWARLHALETAVGVDSLLEYIPRVTPNWVAPWHLAPVAELFVRAEYEPVQGCVSVPPRFGKTELILHAISWWLHRHPQDHIQYVSYSGDFAHGKNLAALDIARRAGLDIRADVASSVVWQIKAGGTVRANGAGGGQVTGHGANLMIIDDPFADREEAESPTIRRKRWEWLLGTINTRIEPGGSIIIVHTRWHEDDLIGRLISKRPGQWDIVNLPAVNEDGESLWPWRWSSEDLAKKRKGSGEYVWWSQYMGSPSPKGGGMFKLGWWRFYKTNAGILRPDGCVTHDDCPAIELPKLDRVIISVDAAFRKTERGSRVSMLVIGSTRKQPADRFVLDNLTKPMTFRESCANLLMLGQRYPMAKKKLIEGKANGDAIVDFLSSQVQGLIVVNPDGGKESRASMIQHIVESGNEYLPEGAAWPPSFVGEHAMFPSGSHDDQVDSNSQGLNYMQTSSSLQRTIALGEW